VFVAASSSSSLPWCLQLLLFDVNQLDVGAAGPRHIGDGALDGLLYPGCRIGPGREGRRPGSSDFVVAACGFVVARTVGAAEDAGEQSAETDEESRHAAAYDGHVALDDGVGGYHHVVIWAYLSAWCGLAKGEGRGRGTTYRLGSRTWST
jgi:hypothetical protein